VREDFDAAEFVGVAHCVSGGRDRPDRNIIKRAFSVALQDRSVLRAIQIEFEDHAVRLRELLTALPGESWTRRRVLRPVTHLHDVREAFPYVQSKAPVPATTSSRIRPYHEVTRALSGYGEFVDDAGEVRAAIEHAIASGVPAVFNVAVDPAIYSPYTEMMAALESA